MVPLDAVYFVNLHGRIEVEGGVCSWDGDSDAAVAASIPNGPIAFLLASFQMAR
jgi:hypothetical protein